MLGHLFHEVELVQLGEVAGIVCVHDRNVKTLDVVADQAITLFQYLPKPANLVRKTLRIFLSIIKNANEGYLKFRPSRLPRSKMFWVSMSRTISRMG